MAGKIIAIIIIAVLGLFIIGTLKSIIETLKERERQKKEKTSAEEKGEQENK